MSAFNAPLGAEEELAKWIKTLSHPVAIYTGSDRRATSDLSLQEIAKRPGFRTASALANLFKAKTGLTPRTYRAEHHR